MILPHLLLGYRVDEEYVIVIEYRAPTGRLRFRGSLPIVISPTGILLLLAVRRVQALEVNQA